MGSNVEQRCTVFERLAPGWGSISTGMLLLLLLLVPSPWLLAQEPEEGQLLPVPNPVFEKKKDWQFDGQGNLHFNKKSPNKDGTYWIRWKVHRWMISEDQILIRGFDGLCLSVYLDRRSERDPAEDLTDREAMEMLLDYAHEEYKAKNLAGDAGFGPCLDPEA